jgi:hypothetical protein
MNHRRNCEWNSSLEGVSGDDEITFLGGSPVLCDIKTELNYDDYHRIYNIRP